MAEEYGAPETRARILDAAWDLIEEGDEVTMGAVAARAEVSRQAVYLHVGDRSGLLTALVGHMDRALGLDERARQVFAAPTGAEALQRLVAMIAEHHPRIIGVARVLDAARQSDPDAAAAWDDRMASRLQGSQSIVQRLADEGRLAPTWDVDTAATLLYALTLPRLWDEFINGQGWSSAQYRDHLTTLLTRTLIRDTAPPSRSDT